MTKEEYKSAFRWALGVLGALVVIAFGLVAYIHNGLSAQVSKLEDLQRDQVASSNRIEVQLATTNTTLIDFKKTVEDKFTGIENRLDARSKQPH